MKITDDIIDAVKDKLVEIYTKTANGKNEKHLFITGAWKCYICLNINYAMSDNCHKCGCLWTENRDVETNRPLRAIQH